MITTRRSSENSVSEYSYGGKQAAVGVLERKPVQVQTGAVNVNNTVTEEDSNAARERMKNNLKLLLNYDTVAPETTANADEKVEEAVESAAAKAAIQDDDIKPTSTTMQFGDEDIDVYKEMNRANEEKTSYRLNSKGKLAIAIYSVIVTVILALIILNTGVLTMMSQKAQAKAETLTEKVAMYGEINSKISEVSDSSYVADYAESELGMIKR